jgi:hypothetical protein
LGKWWYLVGLITTDGCLSSDGRHIDITAKDYAFLSRLKDAVGVSNKIGAKFSVKKQAYYRIQIGNKNFYNFLLSIGLLQRKSLTLKAVKVPDQFFADFLRGVIDGDGCIRRWIHPSNRREQWSVRIYSGSEDFIQWLKDKVEALIKIRGGLYRERDRLWILKYGKMAAREIAKYSYYKKCVGLDRKIELFRRCLDSYKGWEKSNAVLN